MWELTEHLQYEDPLNCMLRDWLICGINNERNEQLLLSESSSLKLQKTLDIITLWLQFTITQAAVIQDSNTENHRESEDKLILKEVESKRKKCYNCGGKHFSTVL